MTRPTSRSSRTTPSRKQEGIDAYTAALVTLCREITEPSFAPVRIEMRRAAPPCAAELERRFACPVVHDSPMQPIVLRRAQIDRVLPRRNAAIARASDDIALRDIAALDREDVVAGARVALRSGC